MWVRSQDRRILIKADGFQINEERTSSSPYAKKRVFIKTTARAMGAYYILGEYDTVDRALEVLDKIAECKSHDVVFQMPE